MPEIEPKIIFEDGVLIVVSKPSGMTVNKADTTKDETTLQDWVIARFRSTNYSTNTYEKLIEEEYNPEYEFYSRAGIIHRLDKETSGIILIAKNVDSFAKVQKQFKERTTKKSYVALAHGKIIPPEGQITVPVGRLPFNRKRFGVIAGGREALTEYKTIQHYQLHARKGKEDMTLVELLPKTGRTHQIRVHLKYLNHPIVSDPLYAGRKIGRDDRILLSRLFLHAAKIAFDHPVTKQRVEFESSLPDELETFLHRLTVVTQ